MSEKKQFSHIYLKQVVDAPVKKRKNGFPRKADKRTKQNLKNRSVHSEKLLQSTMRLKGEWKESQQERKRNNLPEVPEAISLFLQIDPDAMLIEDLRKFGIEVISELENGFIIGASSDLELSELEKKIKKFSEQEQNNVACLWEIHHGIKWRPEHILSPLLLKEWPSIKDHQVFVVDVGIACLGTLYIPQHPKRSNYKSEEAYLKAVANWERKRDQVFEQWDELADQRHNMLSDFIRYYGGEFLSGYSVDVQVFNKRSQLPDSFTCRIRISGKGLRDLVYNFPYLFDVTEVMDIGNPVEDTIETDTDMSGNEIIVKTPEKDSPYVCVIDSGIQERHLLLKTAIDSDRSFSWIKDPNEVSDYVQGGGHGTRVAGAVLYPRDVPTSGVVEPVCWIQNARVLDDDNKMPKTLFPPALLEEIVEYYHKGPTKTRIFNHSINSLFPCRKIHMSAWAAAIDKLTWENDILFVVSAGNLPRRRLGNSNIRLGIIDHLSSGRKYPEYLLEDSCRIADPAQSLQAITVGSIAVGQLSGDWYSLSRYSEPSSYSCTGPGIWGTIKPEVVEYGGDYAFDSGNPPNLTYKSELSPSLVRSTLHGGAGIGRDRVGTSFAAPKVAHILANIQKTFPQHSTLLYRALLIQSARWPDWTSNRDKSEVIRHIGYGIPDVSRATENSPYRITLIRDNEWIKARQIHIYEVKIPDEIRRPGDSYNIRIDITLSYKAEPRRTRRNKRRYLSTWLDWKTNKKYESAESFIKRMIDIAANEGEESAEETTNNETIPWVIKERSDWGVKNVSRSSGTVQKDWAVIKSFELGESFCIAVIGHEGWNIDPDASVPYSLAVSFEAIDQDIEIYSQIAILNEVETEVMVPIE